jgi:hypothetical protein
LYVSQSDNLIRKITPNGTVTTIAGTVSPLNSPFVMPRGMFFDNIGNLYIESSYQIEKITPNGVISNFAGIYNQQNDTLGIISSATFGFLEGMVIDSNGNFYISESNEVREITTE